jgi:nucleoside 2-deoxyribosyltransferase
MRVAIFGKKHENNLGKFIEKLTNILEDQGIKGSQVDLSYFASEIEKDFEDSEKVFERIKRIILKSDAIIIESSLKSEGISFISGFALALNKPTLMLFDEKTRSSDRSFSTVLMGTSALNRSYLKKYNSNDTNTLRSIVRDFILKTKDQIESKFYIILSSEINKYLEWWSYYNRTTKVSKIRDLLIQDMESNVEWQKVIK